MAASEHRWRLAARRLGPSALGLLVIASLAYLLYLAATGTTVKPKRLVEEMTVVRIVEPVPPKPPEIPKQKFVEQPKVQPQETRPMETPVEAPTPPAPTPKAGPSEPAAPAQLAAQGEGPSDSFALTGNPGGADLGGGGGGGGGGGSAFGWYAQLLESRVTAALRRERRLKGVHYRVFIQIWVSPSGAVQRTEYISTSGKADVDRTIQETFKGLGQLPEPPPAGMPQPIVLRLDSNVE